MSVNKVVIDTQLFLRAAANLKSLPAKIIFEMRHLYQLVVSEGIVAEIRDVLNRPKLRAKFPNLTDDITERVLALLASAETVTLTEVPPVSRDPKDDVFLACAKVAGAEYIVSEDKDLLVLNPYEGIQIINALDFLKALQAQPPPDE